MEFCGHSSPTDYFYPRPPRGGRLLRSVRQDVRNDISIHALREEGDSASVVAALDTLEFLSTPSARRATQSTKDKRSKSWISIHALREEGDRRHPRKPPTSTGNFYPRPPRGGRPSYFTGETFNSADFYPRPPRGGRRSATPEKPPASEISIHALREEGDLADQQDDDRYFNFYPRPPRGGRPTAFPASSTITKISIHALREEGDSKNRDKISIFL